jgi:hypothetical protein
MKKEKTAPLRKSIIDLFTSECNLISGQILTNLAVNLSFLPKTEHLICLLIQLHEAIKVGKIINQPQKIDGGDDCQQTA